MAVNNNFLTKIDLNEFDNFQNNIPKNFKYSLDINSELESEIKKIYKQTLNNVAKTQLNCFHLEYIKMFEKIAKKHSNQEKLFEFSKDILDYIGRYFSNLNYNLSIENEEDFKDLLYHLNLVFFMMEGAMRTSNVELGYEAFFQMSSRINVNNDKNIRFVGENDEYLFSMVITKKTNRDNQNGLSIKDFKDYTSNLNNYAGDEYYEI